MPPRSDFPVFTSRSDARTAVLQELVIAAIAVTALYVGKDVLLPLALAILLSFILTPPLLLTAHESSAGSLCSSSGYIRLPDHFGAWMGDIRTGEAACCGLSSKSTLTEKIDRLRKSAVDAPVIRQATNAFKRLELEFANPKPDTPVGTQPARRRLESRTSSYQSRSMRHRHNRSIFLQKSRERCCRQLLRPALFSC